MSFQILKHIHVTCAALSFTLFFLRGIWSLNGSAIMRQQWVKIVPHIVDTLLLASALGLAYIIEQYPLVDGWLTAKFFALLLYIGLGTVALKHGKTKTVRLSAWLAALAVFIYIVLVAMNHDPVPFIH
ncbi:MAG: regulator SirB [Gallionellales bacterium RIFCSPLOWO2_12_FULL_57_18]|nr:MAG: regulator SirB [Gallionellales bacterium RIFCSPLOWO2_02_FULL_57_47]OGS95440.1 MAG: regulator SirB [Gallionellales bacterium RIFCSPLOWO2_12_FULL_57_18]OGT08678.1 MAG: regulator SirB [Gallionellales bacterium RIFCSPHIGHO2_02_FULL_57_16]